MNDDSDHDLRELAVEIARRIAAEPSLAAAFASRWPGQVCPPTKLCCFQGYYCSNHFTCQRDFRCPNGFNTSDFLP